MAPEDPLCGECQEPRSSHTAHVIGDGFEVTDMCPGQVEDIDSFEEETCDQCGASSYTGSSCAECERVRNERAQAPLPL